MSEEGPRVLTHIPPGLLQQVRDAHPDVEIVSIPFDGEIPAEVRGEVLLTQAWGSPNLADAVSRGVRWVHAYGTGVNDFPFEHLGDRPLTCSRGASAIPISEWVLAVMLAHEKKLPDTWIHEPPEHWNRGDLGGLHERTLGLVGFGGIGRAVAERALAFGMRVVAHRRTFRPSEWPGVEMVRSMEEVLAAADHLVIAAPATRETRHLIDAAALARMKPTAHLVNVARGELVDQEALRSALDDDGLALASLDTVEPEPLPEGHWLYSHPKVRLSPHCSWAGPGALDRLTEPFVENLGRFRRGETLLDPVDVSLGY